MYDFYDILDLGQFSEPVKAYLSECYKAWKNNASLQEAVRLYPGHERSEKSLAAFSEQSGLHRYTADLLMLLISAISLGAVYKKKNYPDDSFAAIIRDIRSKTEECRTVHGIIGTFDLVWFDRYFELTRFAIGRLQFEPNRVHIGYRDLVKAGDTVYYCHIPSGSPLTEEAVENSLAQFYAMIGHTGALPVFCESWLLYPPFAALFKVGSNLQKFAALFDVIETTPYENYDHLGWRIFGTADPDMETWPKTSSLQKALYEYIKQGGKPGYGSGYLIYTPSSMQSPKVENT